ncbi:MAG: penicillin-binding protein 2 [Phycisphaerales bacterium]|nr:penicillin-binding protein 2 [Phycisphaerales bacterium]
MPGRNQPAPPAQPAPSTWTGRTAARADRLAGVAAITTTVALGVMLLRVAQLQLAPSIDLARQEEIRVTSKADLPPRGDLLDRKGRLLATTRFGYRVVIDPTLIPSPPDALIVSLARATDLPEEEIGERILSKIAENAQRRSAAAIPEPVLSTSTAPSSPDLPYEDAPGPIRYVPLGDILTDRQTTAVRELKLPGVWLEQRPVREFVGGPDVAKIVGKVGPDELSPNPPAAPRHDGLIGAERALNDRLTGSRGKVSFVRDAYGQPLWVEPGFIQPAVAGEDIRLALDAEVQRMAREELERGIRDADAAGGRAVVVDPLTGEILAMVDIARRMPDAADYPWVDEPARAPRRKGQPAPPPARIPSIEDFPRRRYIVIKEDPQSATHPALSRNRCVEDIYEPGSTFKPFVWSTITELKLAGLDEVFDTEGGRWSTPFGRHIEDVTKREHMTWREVLVNSSNIGMIKGADRLTFRQLHDAVERFGFGKPTGLGLPGEASGIVTPMSRWSKYTQTSVPTGYEVAVTPVQMARAFSAFCREGSLAGTLPQLRMAAVRPDDPDVAILYRVLPSEIAILTRETMTGVADAMERKLATADPSQTGWLYTMFGKSGTAEIPLGKPPKGKRAPRGASGYFDDQYTTSFIAGAPLEAPRLVVLCVIDDPGPQRVRARTHYGAATAGPVVRRIMDRALSYMGVPPSPRPIAPPTDSAAAPAGPTTPASAAITN